jgi:hypothetical protein
MKFKVLAQVGKFSPGEIIELEKDLPNLSQFITQGFLEEIEENLPPPSSPSGESEEEEKSGGETETLTEQGKKTKRRKKK